MTVIDNILYELLKLNCECEVCVMPVCVNVCMNVSMCACVNVWQDSRARVFCMFVWVYVCMYNTNPLVMSKNQMTLNYFIKHIDIASHRTLHTYKFSTPIPWPTSSTSNHHPTNIYNNHKNKANALAQPSQKPYATAQWEKGSNHGNIFIYLLWSSPRKIYKLTIENVSWWSYSIQ